MVISRGYRNRNPGNVRWDGRTSWKGMVGSDKDNFVVFEEAEYGYRAMARILRSYVNRGHDTIYKIISRWAPHSENDTEGYASFISNALGIGRDEVLDLEEVAVPLIRAMSHFENGYVRHTDEVIRRGVEASRP